MPDFESRFQNWLRWCREGKHEPDGSCGSVEGMWCSPQVWERVEPDMALLNPVDWWDAVEVQRAFVVLPERPRRAIKFVYFRPHWRIGWIAQKLGCTRHEVGEKVGFAKLMLANRLARAYKPNQLRVKPS